MKCFYGPLHMDKTELSLQVQLECTKLFHKHFSIKYNGKKLYNTRKCLIDNLHWTCPVPLQIITSKNHCRKFNPVTFLHDSNHIHLTNIFIVFFFFGEFNVVRTNFLYWL